MPDEIVFLDESPTLFETAAFGTTGHAYVMSFENGQTIANPPGDIIITEQISVS
jgi:hypothetical protein